MERRERDSTRAGRHQLSRRGFMRRALGAGLALPTLTALHAACSPAPAAQTARPAPGASPAAGASAGARTAGLESIIEAAKREGELHWIDASVQQSNDEKFHTAFKQMFGLPDSFRARHTLKGTGDVATQVQQEIQASNVTVDFVWLGDLAFFKGLESANALLDYTPTELAALEPTIKRLGFPTQPPKWWTITSYCFAPAWNKRFVRKEIRSWNDLIDPAFRDKTIQGDIRTSSTQTDSYIALRQALGVEWFERYAEVTNPILIFRTPEQQQKITSGERILTNFAITARAYQAQREDPSLEFGAAFPVEGVCPLPIPAGILAKAPHPNAARLFAEFLVSREGQQIWLSEECQWPLRTDVSYPPDILPFLTPLDQIKVLTLDWDHLTPQVRDEARAEFRRIFKLS
jgi:iron(III) transport system substrate-binding protein